MNATLYTNTPCNVNFILLAGRAFIPTAEALPVREACWCPGSQSHSCALKKPGTRFSNYRNHELSGLKGVWLRDTE
jgi:hypothetical protein